MSDKVDLVYIKHIRDAISKIENYTGGISRDDFLDEDNDMMRDAVVRALEIIGEATNNIDKETKTRYPEIPWRDMIDTRNKIIHDYMSVDYELVWDIVVKDLPKLKAQINELLS